VLFYNEHIGGN
jgi:hypothetical protein